MKTLKLISFAFLLLLSGMLNAQTIKKMTVEDGGTGAFKAEIVSDAKLPAFTIYRPAKLPATPLPVVLYGNGACMNSSVEARYFLNELASHGYIIIAIGPYNEKDFIAHWTDVMKMMHPGTKQVILADGTEVKKLSEKEMQEFFAKRSESEDDTPQPDRAPTYPGQLLEALDWLTAQNADGQSEYYGHIDLSNVAVMGQSCGGAQALAVIHDPRISTGIILNSGIGDMEMQGATSRSLQNIRVPMLYVVGGDTDVATENATKDFVAIKDVPVFMVNTIIDGHEGSYYEKHGGKYAVLVAEWLDWQLKGKADHSASFLDENAFKAAYSGWTIDRKNESAMGPRLRPDNIDEIVAAMTLEEKAHMVNGIGTFWGGSASTRNLRDIPGAPGGMYEIKRLGIPPLYMGDGPLGLRIDEKRDWDSHHYYTTAVPVPLLVASSWDPSVVYEGAQDIAEECRDYGVDVMLGPSFNLIRNPLGGRTHEYYSEDPLLAGKMAAAFTKGVQSVGIGASVKHFAANNQETNRNAVNSVVSQRALRELYLKSFEIAVKEAEPWTVMTSYNGLNGEWTSESRELLEDVLRGDWGFKGMVMTDWGGGTHPVQQMLAGNDLLEPGSEEAAQEIIEAVRSGKLDEKILDQNVHRVLELVVKSFSYRNYPFTNKPDLASHQAMARSSAAEGAILLKNDNEALPFASSVKNVAIYGKTGYDVIPGGIGHFENNTGNYCISLVEGLRLAGYNVDGELLKNYPRRQNVNPFAVMSGEVKEEPDVEPSFTSSELDAQTSRNDLALIILGHVAGEGNDRTMPSFYLNESEKALLKDVTAAYHKAGKQAIVILNIPGPVEVESWKDIPDAILCIYQGGEQLGNWVADVLKGAVTPSGKLTVTFAKDVMDYPSSKNFPVVKEALSISGMMAGARRFEKKDKMTVDGERNKDYTIYEEGVYVGYRYFDSFNVPVTYPFGYGLSYTTFEYSDATLSQDGNDFTVKVKVTNTGQYAGKEVVQLYVAAPKGKLDKPVKELRSFAKTGLLRPGESETLTMTVSVKDLASFNSAKSAWETDKGTYIFHVAANVSDVKASLSAKVAKPWSSKVRNVLKPQVVINELKNK